MFRMDAMTDDTIITFHDPFSETTRVVSDSFSEEIGKIESFSFKLTPNNPLYNQIKPMKTRVTIYDLKNNRAMFKGRVINYNPAMSSNGDLSINVNCEGILGMLHDSEQKAMSYAGTVNELVKRLLETHNEQVEEYKQFDIGICDIGTTFSYINTSGTTTTSQKLNVGDVATISNDATNYYHHDGSAVTIPNFVKGRKHTVESYNSANDRYLLHYNDIPIAWVNSADIVETKTVKTTGTTTTKKVEVQLTIEAEITEGMSTYDALQKCIIQPFGGYMIWSEIEGVNMLNLYREFGEESMTRLELGVNMISINEKVDPTKIITRIRPIGIVKSTGGGA